MNNKELSQSSERDLVNLNHGDVLDLSGLSSEARHEITEKHANAVLDLKTKAQEAQLDIQGTKVQLDNFTDTVKKANEDGTAATITHTQSNSLGRTEIIMGNTETAAKGKLSRSARGDSDVTMKVVIAGGIFAVIIVALMSS